MKAQSQPLECPVPGSGPSEGVRVEIYIVFLHVETLETTTTPPSPEETGRSPVAASHHIIRQLNTEACFLYLPTWLLELHFFWLIQASRCNIKSNHQGPVYVKTLTSGFPLVLKWWRTFALWQQKEQRVSWVGVWLGHWQRVWREYWPVWQDRQTANIRRPAGATRQTELRIYFVWMECIWV